MSARQEYIDMAHYRKTDPTTAMSNLIKHALIVQRWAEHEGSASQKQICAKLMEVLTHIAPKITSVPISIPLSDMASYTANQQLFVNRPVDIAAMNRANQREYDEGKQAAIDGKDYDADNPYGWQDADRNSAWNRGFHDQTKAANPEG
jgi:hypothetical protein